MKHQVINMDCVEYLRNELLCPQEFDLIIANPPSNTGQNYQSHKDAITEEQYNRFTESWITHCFIKLKPGGVILLHGSTKICRTITRILFLLNLEKFVEQEIVWAYNSGQCNFNRFTETHCRIIVVRKPGGKRKWNIGPVLTPSKRLLMGDKRVQTSKYKGMIPHGTVWGVKSEDGVPLEPIECEPNWSRTQGNNKEHPHQLPERYMERIISAYSNARDTIFDPFGGSGTTIAIAKYLNRNCITTDINKWNCDSIKQRLEAASV